MTYKPGLYDLDRAAYDALPAFNASGAVKLMEKCAAAYWATSPWNPNRLPEKDDDRFDLGTAAHLRLLQGDQWADRTVIVDADSWQTKAAKEARDQAREEGRTAILLSQSVRVAKMIDALGHWVDLGIIAGALAERTLIWHDPETSLRCKARPDLTVRKEISRTARLIDYKTTSCAKASAFARSVFQFGYHQQEAFYRDGHTAATTGFVPCDEFLFLVQEIEPPYLATVCRLDEDAVAWGRKLNRKAIDECAHRLETGEWPGYRDPSAPDDPHFIHPVALPAYAEFQLQDRDSRREFVSRRFLEAAAEADVNPFG